MCFSSTHSTHNVIFGVLGQGYGQMPELGREVGMQEQNLHSWAKTLIPELQIIFRLDHTTLGC